MDTSTLAVVPETIFNRKPHAAGMSAKLVLVYTVALLSFCASVPAFAQYGLTCASEDGHRHYCAADTRGGVTMQRQRSHSACVQGSSWGFDQQGVWVDHGCRAEFMVNTRQVAGPGDRDRDNFHGHDADHDRDFNRDHHDFDGDHHDFDHD